MGFKKTDPSLSFADLALVNSLDRNRAISRLHRIGNLINWSPIEILISKNFPINKNAKGGFAYVPLLLMRCLLLRDWFCIDSDRELETQINDRISFKKFLGLPLEKTAPDHSTLSRFRSRLTLETLEAIKFELKSQFASKGLAICEGLSRDPCLVSSGSFPAATDRLREKKLPRETTEQAITRWQPSLPLPPDEKVKIPF